MQTVEKTIYRDIKEVERFCKNFLRKEYGLNVFFPIERNNRLRRTLGIFRYTQSRPLAIEFSGFFLENGREDQILSTMKHECIHYALFTLGRDFRDGDTDFENELRKHGARSTGTQHVSRKQKIVYYSCGCQMFPEKRRYNRGIIYDCATCGNELRYIKTEIVFR